MFVDRIVYERVKEHLSICMVEFQCHCPFSLENLITSSIFFFLSPCFFLRKKKDGTYRMILNLRDFNKNVENIHFKMETLANVRQWIKNDAYCVGIDLKDAFLHVPMHDKVKKFLRFKWQGKLYKK